MEDKLCSAKILMLSETQETIKMRKILSFVSSTSEIRWMGEGKITGAPSLEPRLH